MAYVASPPLGSYTLPDAGSGVESSAALLTETILPVAFGTHHNFFVVPVVSDLTSGGGDSSYAYPIGG